MKKKIKLSILFFISLTFVFCLSVNSNTKPDKMANQAHTDPSLMNYLSTVLKIDTNNLMIRDFSKSFPWIGGKKLFCVFNHDTDEAFILLEEIENKWLQLNKSENSSKFYFLTKPLVDSTDFNSPDEVRKLSKTVYQLYNDPRSELLDDIFLLRKEKNINSYLMPNMNNTELLKSYCKKIIVNRKGDYWELIFNTMNKKGAILSWNVLIKDKIQGINIIQLEKDKTFYFPNEY